MTLTIRFWANLKEITGTDTLTMDIPEGASLAAVLADLYDDYPRLADWDKSLLLAVGLEYATRDQLLRHGDEISLMPPVQGG